MKRKKLIFVLACLVCVLACSAQIMGEHYYFKCLDVRNGLSQNTVYAILQDRTGFMWFGTKDGLNRYDGSSFKQFKYDRTDKHSIGNNYILSLYEDIKGNIWIGTDVGLYIYYPERDIFEAFKQLSAEQTTIDYAVPMISGDKDGGIWIMVESQGIFYYNVDTKELKNYTLKDFPFISLLNIANTVSNIGIASIIIGAIKTNAVYVLATPSIDIIARENPIKFEPVSPINV